MTDRVVHVVGATLAKLLLPKFHESPLVNRMVDIHLGRDEEYNRRKRKAEIEMERHMDAIEEELRSRERRTGDH